MASGTLKTKVVGGIAWNVMTQVTSQCCRVAVGIVLARLLTPHEFGLVGMAVVFTNFLGLFTDVGLGAALIQRPELTEQDRSTMFWVAAIVGFACSALGVALSPVVADFFGQPQVGPLFAVMSLGFAFGALSSTQQALLRRELSYRKLQIREIASVMVGAAVGIAAAVAGLGAWAIVSQQLAATVAATVMIWALSSWRPRLLFSRASLRDLGGFGAKLFASRVLAYANLNGDNLLVGRFLGSGALGIYSFAYSVMFTPMVQIGLPLQDVLFPAYSRLQSDPSRLGAAWLRSKRLSAAILAPAFVGILVVAPDLVPLVFGEKWRPAVLVVQLLCVAGLAHTLVTLNSTVLQARGEAGVLIWINVLYSVVTVGAFILGLRWGVAGVAGCYAAAKWLLVVPHTWVTARSVSLRSAASLRTSGVAVPAAVIAGLLAYVLRAALVAGGMPALPELTVVLIAGGLAYLAVLIIMAPDLVHDVKGLRRPTSRPRGTPTATEAPA